MSPSGHPPQEPPFPRPPKDLEAQVSGLLERAREHPQGLELLRDGYPDSVAAIFGVSAFVVTETRKLLRHNAAS